MTGLLAPTEPVLRLTPYQVAWMRDQSRFKIGMFARQSGKTFVACAEAVDDCFRAWVEGRRVRWLILSRGERQAATAITDAVAPLTRAFFSIYRHNLAKRRGRTVAQPGQEQLTLSVSQFKPSDAETDATYLAFEVRFPGGSRITALPANPDTARGYSANVILDEFAFHTKPNAIWGALYPSITRHQQKVRVISTPAGKGNKFHELMTAPDSPWSRHVVDIHDAVRQGLNVDIDELRRGLADEDAWAQEYELKWLDEASAWLSMDLITACEDRTAGIPEQYAGGSVVLGVDIAARNNLFVIWVAEPVGDVLWTREIITRRHATFAEHDALLDDVFRRYRVTRCAMDQTGMGEKPVEDARRRYGSTRVEGVLLSVSTKLDLAIELKDRMQRRRLRIPAEDRALRADLHAIRSQPGPAGMQRLVADGSTDGHADRFWAAALTCAAAQGAVLRYDYQRVGFDPGSYDGMRLPLGAKIRGSVR